MGVGKVPLRFGDIDRGAADVMRPVQPAIKAGWQLKHVYANGKLRIHVISRSF